MACKTESSRKRCEGIRIVIHKQQAGFWGHSLSLRRHGHFVSWVRLRYFIDIPRQFDRESRSRIRLALNRDSAAMIAHDRLHNCQAKSGAMLLGGEVRGKESLTLFRCETEPGIPNLHTNTRTTVGGSYCQSATVRHGINCIGD